MQVFHIFKEMLHRIKPVCASGSAWLLLCLLTQSELAGGCQYVLLIALWMYPQGRTSSGVPQLHHSHGHIKWRKGSSKEFSLPYFSVLLDFYVVVQ